VDARAPALLTAYMMEIIQKVIFHLYTEGKNKADYENIQWWSKVWNNKNMFLK